MGLMDSISYVGDSLDKLGGRPLRGLLGGRPRELASLIPFSDSLGITDPNQIVSGRNLTDKAGLTRRGDKGFGSSALGFGAEMLLDPTNLIPGKAVAKAVTGGSHRLSQALRGGAHLGDIHPAMLIPPGGGNWPSHLANAADRVGPGFAGGREKMAKILANAPAGMDAQIRALFKNPFIEHIAGEVPEGSTLLGHGGEAFALRTPDNTAIRIGPHHSPFMTMGSMPPQGRANILEMLQPHRSNLIGPHLVEHLSMVRPLREGGEMSKVNEILKHLAGSHGAGDAAYQAGGRLVRASESIADHLADRIASGPGGLKPWDVSGHNISLTDQGRGIVHDGGAVFATDHARPIPFPAIHTPSPRDLADLAALGDPHEAVRRAMEAGQAIGTKGQGVPLSGISGLQGGATELLRDRDALSRFIEQHAHLIPHGGTPVTRQLAFTSSDPAGILAALNGSTSDFATATSGALGKAAATGGGLNPRFKGLRDQITMIKDYAGPGQPYRTVAGKSGPKVSRAFFEPAAQKAFGKTPAAGYFSPAGAYGVLASLSIKKSVANPAVRAGVGRHEVGHGLVSAAIAAGPAAISKLPPAWQPAAWLKLLGQKTGYGGTLGRYAEEAAMYGTQHRGLMDQLKGTGRFLASPDLAKLYGQQYQKQGAGAVARLIQAPPWIAAHPGQAAAMAALPPYELARLSAIMRHDQSGD